MFRAQSFQTQSGSHLLIERIFQAGDIYTICKWPRREYIDFKKPPPQQNPGSSHQVFPIEKSEVPQANLEVHPMKRIRSCSLASSPATLPAAR